MTKQKKCKGCGEPLEFVLRGKLKVYNQKYDYGLKCCYTNWRISDDPKAKETFDKFLIKNKTKVEKEKRLIEKDKKNDIVDWKPKLQIKINEIVRLIDIGLPCLAKGIHANQIHAGHVYARGGNSSIKYNLHNIHRQSAQSNHYQNDDGLLREGLVKEYGYKYMDFVSELRQTPTLKYSNQDYREFTKHASKIALELKRQGRTFSTINERIFMRNEINNQLGIYDNKYCEFEITKL